MSLEEKSNRLQNMNQLIEKKKFDGKTGFLLSCQNSLAVAK
jgi:hypothetical protein